VAPEASAEATRADGPGANSSAANGTTAEGTNIAGNATKKATAPQERNVRILLQSESVSAVTVDLTGEEFRHAQRRLDALKVCCLLRGPRLGVAAVILEPVSVPAQVAEVRQRRTAAALNALEAFAFDTQRRMEEEEYQAVTTGAVTEGKARDESNVGGRSPFNGTWLVALRRVGA
jgi:hypothetical protein